MRFDRIKAAQKGVRCQFDWCVWHIPALRMTYTSCATNRHCSMLHAALVGLQAPQTGMAQHVVCRSACLQAPRTHETGCPPHQRCWPPWLPYEPRLGTHKPGQSKDTGSTKSPPPAPTGALVHELRHGIRAFPELERKWVRLHSSIKLQAGDDLCTSQISVCNRFTQS